MDSKSKSTLRPDTPLPTEQQSPWQGQKSISPLTNDLLSAARKGLTNEVKRIIAEGGGSKVAQSFRDRQGRNCLHLACHYGKLETVLAILNMDILDINSTSKRGFTPLHEASGEGHLQVVFLLLAMGAFLMARSKEGWTALMSACYNGHIHIAKVLVAAGLDVNASNKNGFTALHVAAWRGNSTLVEILFQEGAMATQQTNNNKTALDIAIEEGQLETATILRTASANKESSKLLHKIATLESQLKYSQKKLVQTQQKDEEFFEEKPSFESTKTHNVQLITPIASNGINSEEVCKVQKNTQATMNSPSDDSSNSKLSKLTEEMEPSVPVVASPLISRQFYSPNIKSKNKRDNLLDTLNLEEFSGGFDRVKRHSLDGVAAVPRSNCHDKLTITQLVESSLHNPSTIASIRKQLKEDGLTPKIKKKFESTKVSEK